jgi:hypothetical protein
MGQRLAQPAEEHVAAVRRPVGQHVSRGVAIEVIVADEGGEVADLVAAPLLVYVEPKAVKLQQGRVGQ